MVLKTSWGAGSVVLQRRLHIADRIRRCGTTRVEALAEALSVSVVTIRADLAYLEEQGLVMRASGTARPVPGVDEQHRPPVPARRGAYLAALRACASMIGDDQTLLLGPGTLVTHLLAELSDRRGLTVLLAALDDVTMARHCLDATLHVLGGELGADGSTLGGPQSVHGLAAHRIDLFVLQASSVACGFATLPPGASEPLHLAGCRHAAGSIALVSEESRPAAHAAHPRVPLAGIGHLALARPPGAAMRAMLEEAGFSAAAAAGAASGALDHALLFGHDRRAEWLRSA